MINIIFLHSLIYVLFYIVIGTTQCSMHLVSYISISTSSIMQCWFLPQMLTGPSLIVMAAVSMALSLPVKETWSNWFDGISCPQPTHDSVFHTDDISRCVLGGLFSLKRNLISCSVMSFHLSSSGQVILVYRPNK